MTSPERSTQTHKLSQAEMEKHVARMTQPHRPAVARDPFPICPIPRIPKHEIDRVTTRLYSHSVAQKEKALMASEAQLSSLHKPHRKLTEEELETSVDRLYNQSLERKKNLMENSRKRYLFHRAETKPVPLQSFVQHMYYDQLQREKETKERLYNTYMTPNNMTAASVSHVAEDVSAARHAAIS